MRNLDVPPWQKEPCLLFPCFLSLWGSPSLMFFTTEVLLMCMSTSPQGDEGKGRALAPHTSGIHLKLCVDQEQKGTVPTHIHTHTPHTQCTHTHTPFLSFSNTHSPARPNANIHTILTHIHARARTYAHACAHTHTHYPYRSLPALDDKCN